MRILVGTLHCGENEIHDCRRSIELQTHRDWEHFVLSDLPNKEAHDTLYQTFMDRAADFDLFMKVDADMVLHRDSLFDECVREFQADSGLGHLEIAVDDWMTDRRVFGLHVYRSGHRWLKSDERIFVDGVDHTSDRKTDTSRLAPAALHCPNPSEFHAYHFGVHKGVKFVQSGVKKINLPQRVSHWFNFECLADHYRRRGDRRLLLAMVGFVDALVLRLGPDDVDYDCHQTRKRFEERRALPDAELRLIANRFYKWLRRLPEGIRFEVAQYFAGDRISASHLFNTAFRLLRRVYYQRRAAIEL